jgi:NADPH:quinone reductase-like Zn-dependent oxidoreductase
MTRTKKVLLGALIIILGAAAALAAVVSHDTPCPAMIPAAAAPAMKAIVYRCYGTPAVLKLESIAIPDLPDDRVQVRVHAASVNPLDWHYMEGKPYVMRAMAGVGAPGDIRLGTDFAGTVEKVGKAVTQFKPGDEVFGGADGAFAELVAVRETRAIALKPANVSFAEAAAAPVAAVTALQALRDKGLLKAGQKVLINGASGGVGTFAVQIAKVLGAEVTGVCSTRNVALVSKLGADHVIDYTHADFTRAPERYDLIIDNVGNRSLAEYRRVLTPTGSLVIVGGPSEGAWLGPLSRSLDAMVVAPFVSQKLIFMLAELKQKDLEYLASLMQEGKLTSVIDRQFPLEQTAAAIAYQQQGHARGKVIVTVIPAATPTAATASP